MVNVQQTLIEDFEAAAHDAVLRTAHRAGHMPIGPILVVVEPWEPEPQTSIEEGKPLKLHHSMHEWELEAQGRAGNICKVVADMELGASLD